MIRVSGPGVRTALETLIDSIPEPRRARLASIRDGKGSVIDRGLVLFFPGPASATGEDVAEFQVHGGRAVVAAMLSALAAMDGFRPAEAGEFARRAFENGIMDLTAVEGLGDLIAAETEAQRRQALRQASGALRTVFEEWRGRLARARALLEADLDFADEEDVPASVADTADEEARAIAEEISRRLDDQHRGERLRDGAEVVIVGAVNAGKSSLVNAIARRDVAIVTAEPGTTRDLIEVRLDIGGYPFTLIDTAGLREADSAIEREGIRRARGRAAAADVLLAVDDVTAPAKPAVRSDTGVLIRVGTKIDLIDSEEERRRISARYDLTLSSRTGEGLDALVSRLVSYARNEMEPGPSSLITRARHRSALTVCRDALLRACERALPVELKAEELRHASEALARLTGRIDVEDLLDVIFREFCIGK